MKKLITQFLVSFLAIVGLSGCVGVGASSSAFQVHPQTIGEPLKIYAQRSALGQNVQEGWSSFTMTYCYSDTPPDAAGNFTPKKTFLTPVKIDAGATPDQVVLIGAEANQAGYYGVQLNGIMKNWLIIAVK